VFRLHVFEARYSVCRSSVTFKLGNIFFTLYKTLTLSKHCLCIVCVCTEALIAAQFFCFVRGNCYCNNILCCCRCGNRCAKYNILYRIFCCCLPYMYSALNILIYNNRFVQLNAKGSLAFEAATFCPLMSIAIFTIRPMNSAILQRNPLQFR